VADVATASNVADWIAGGPCPPCFPLAALRFGFGLHSPGPRDVDGKEDAEEETDDDDDDDTEGDDDAAEEDRLLPALRRPLLLSRMRAASCVSPGELDGARLAGLCGCVCGSPPASIPSEHSGADGRDMSGEADMSLVEVLESAAIVLALSTTVLVACFLFSLFPEAESRGLRSRFGLLVEPGPST